MAEETTMDISDTGKACDDGWDSDSVMEHSMQKKHQDVVNNVDQLRHRAEITMLDDGMNTSLSRKVTRKNQRRASESEILVKSDQHTRNDIIEGPTQAFLQEINVIEQAVSSLKEKQERINDLERKLKAFERSEENLKNALCWARAQFTEWYQVKMTCIKAFQLFQSSLLSRLFRPDNQMLQEFQEITGKDPNQYFLENIQTLIWKFNNDGQYGKYEDWMVPNEPCDSAENVFPTDDYHGLQKSDIVKRFMISFRRNATDSRNRRQVFFWKVICGRGKHSVSQKKDKDSVIKSTLMAILEKEHQRDQQIKFWEHISNPGVIVVVFDYSQPL